jgi:hypothetical protein
MNRLPENKKLDISRTFEDQRVTVDKYIIPFIQKTINKKTFPVVDGVIKHIVHERHRHQREKFLNMNKSEDWNDNEKRRKHANSRRNEVSKKIGLFYF